MAKFPGLPNDLPFPPGKANSISRSLQILSVQQGWDPREIIDDVYKHGQSRYGRSDTSYGMDTMTSNANGQQGGSVDSPDTPRWNRPDVSREKPKRTTNANPYPGMPGSE